MNSTQTGINHNDAECAWIGRTRLVQQWSRMKREILLHKWYESEKAGFDIGWDRAHLDWMVRYGDTVSNERR